VVLDVLEDNANVFVLVFGDGVPVLATKLKRSSTWRSNLSSAALLE